MAQNPSIGIKYFRFRHKSYIFTVFHHRQIPRSGIVESLHNLFHRVANLDHGRGRAHELPYEHLLV